LEGTRESSGELVSVRAACVPAWVDIVRAHDAAGRRLGYAADAAAVEAPGADEDEVGQEQERERDRGGRDAPVSAAAAVAAAVVEVVVAAVAAVGEAAAAAPVPDGEDPQAREVESRDAVRAAAAGRVPMGGGEAAAYLLEREWDGGGTHRGALRLLTMASQSTNGAAWGQAGLGPCWGTLCTGVHKYQTPKKQARSELRAGGSAGSGSTSGATPALTAVKQHWPSARGQSRRQHHGAAGWGWTMPVSGKAGGAAKVLCDSRRDARTTGGELRGLAESWAGSLGELIGLGRAWRGGSGKAVLPAPKRPRS